ncbi:hypothetical protein [Kingella bonacorsii]|uniref:Lipoprotein n=1 Tax=Kingella bonacorsii TaxID=2796361 RepID=A0ABS1BRD0_9NEIS|nr:hypothetical protein [Kingella bonacorsii]MBK0395835.1 hypothetical protein [Kingella bonacorsii]
MKSSPTLTAMLLSAALLSGCGESVPTETSWKEEVLLSDGTRIWVRRTVVGEAYTELGGISAYEVSNRTVEVINAPGLGKPPLWSAKWRTLVLDRDKDGVWYIVVTPQDAEGWTKLEPKLLYAQFKAIDGQWRQVEIDPTLHARDANLEPRFRAGKMPEAVSLDDKPLSKIWGYDSPVVAPQYEYINLKLRY